MAGDVHVVPEGSPIDPVHVEPTDPIPFEEAPPIADRAVVMIPEPEPEPEPASPAPVVSAPHVVSPARRRALMPWAVVAGALVILGATAVGLTYTPVFHAKTITVSGERRLSEQRILKIAGIGPNTDVFHLDMQDVERRLERDPWIADAVVSRHLPSSISVTITERRPVALTRSADGRFVYVAVDGHVLAPARGAPRLPEVQTVEGADVSAMAAGAQVAAALPRSLVPEVASISVDGQDVVVVQTRAGVMATYGDASHPEAKGEALKAVLGYAAAQQRALVSVDVEVPGAPTAVFAGAVASPIHPRT